MTNKPYKKPAITICMDIEFESVLCTSNWTDGTIEDVVINWNEWGEI